MYQALAKRYHYSPQVIADLTPLQQLQMLSPTELEGRTVSFATHKEYLDWLANR